MFKRIPLDCSNLIVFFCTLFNMILLHGFYWCCFCPCCLIRIFCCLVTNIVLIKYRNSLRVSHQTVKIFVSTLCSVCDWPWPRPRCRRPGDRARKEQTPARGDGSHASRHPEHVNTSPLRSPRSLIDIDEPDILAHHWRGLTRPPSLNILAWRERVASNRVWSKDPTLVCSNSISY